MSKLTITKDLAISVMASMPVGMCVADHNGKIVYANPKADEIFGFDREELVDHLVEDFIPKEHRDSHKLLRQNYIANPTNMAMSGGRVLKGVKKNGEKISLQLGLTPLNTTYTLVTFIESSNEIIKPSSSNDPLTGLPNRKLFNEYSEKLQNLAIRNKKGFAIAFIDLDNFKSVNDQFGHQVGDKVICEVASILSNNVRGSDIVARVGGDEFIIFLYDAGNSTNLNKNLAKLVSLVNSFNSIDGNPINIGASIGAAYTCLPQSVEISEMVEMADMLMYKGKQTGKASVIVHDMDC